jgi:probable addiction module antidote protein
MTQTFTRFDALDYLKTNDQIAAYLEDAARDEDPRAMAQALGTVARARNVSQLARETGLRRGEY